MRTTKASRAQTAAAQVAARIEHDRRVALQDLGHRAAKVRGLDYPATCKLLQELEAGTVTIDPVDLTREVETFLTTVRCHEGCKGWVRQYGYAAYKAPKDPSYHLSAHLCEVCALPMSCKNPDGKHTYVELSTAECRTKGIYHGGNCYHVSVCTGCGHVHSVDSSG
jgi:hypothetical protein